MTGQQESQSGPASGGRSLYISIALFASQIGCLSLIIIAAALFGGRWLDAELGTNPIITVILMVGSVPVVLAISIWLARRTASTTQFGSIQKKTGSSPDDGE